MLKRIHLLKEQYLIDKMQFYLWFFVLFILGIISYFSLESEPSIKRIYSFVASITSSLFIIKKMLKNPYRRIIRVIIYIFLAFSLGFIVAKFRTENLRPVIAITTTMSKIVTGKVEQIIPKPNYFQVLLKDVTIEGLETYNTPKKVKINLDSLYPIGSIIKLKAKLYPPKLAFIPGAYDFARIAFFNSLGATGYALSNPEIIKEELSFIEKNIHNLRLYFYEYFLEHLGEKEGGIAVALIIGESGAIDPDILQDMRYSGISHILAVSGLHISLVTLIIFTIIKFLMQKFNLIFNTDFYDSNLIAGIFALVFTFLYLIITDMHISANRAFIMTSIGIIASIFSRRTYSIRITCLAAFIILLFNPEHVLSPSFQLSFIAVIALISFSNFSESDYLLHHKIFLYFKNIMYSSIFASLATSPLVIYNFYLYSNYAVLANLFAIPLTSFVIMPSAVLSCLMLPFHLDFIFLKILKISLTILIIIAEKIAALPYAIINIGHISNLSIMIYMLGFFWLSFMRASWRYLGFIPIIISLYLMKITPYPHFIIDKHANYYALYKDNILYINKPLPAFYKKIWLPWFGTEKVELLENNKIITRNYKNLIINLNKPISLSKSDLKKYGTHLIYCDSDKCKIKNNYTKRFHFND